MRGLDDSNVNHRDRPGILGRKSGPAFRQVLNRALTFH